MKNISGVGVGLRFLFALILVTLSYNPSGYSYTHWVVKDYQAVSPWMVLAGIVLIIGWVVYIRATLRSLGPIGITLASSLVAVLLWALIDLGWLNLSDPSAFVWVLEFFFAGVLCIGMSWSHIRRRLSGQVDVDDMDG